MTIEETKIKEEILRCQVDPHYFATTYLTVNGEPYVTPLSKEEFNKEFERLKTIKMRRHGRTIRYS